MKYRLLVLLIACSVFPGFVSQVQAETLTITGSTTCKSRFLDPGARGFEKETGIKLQTVGIGTGQGLVALIDGKAEVSAASESLKDAIESAKKFGETQGRKISVPSDLMFHKIADDEIAIIVNKNNPVKKLTWKQLQDIHSGAISNWKDVGGPDLPIKIITSHAGSATRMHFQQTVMAGAPYAKTAVTVDATAKEIFTVSKEKGAIGAVSLTFLLVSSWDTKRIETETISRPLGLITKGKPSVQVQKLIDYFTTGKGQEFTRSQKRMM